MHLGRSVSPIQLWTLELIVGPGAKAHVTVADAGVAQPED